jgi:hypothetical protein
MMQDINQKPDASDAHKAASAASEVRGRSTSANAASEADQLVYKAIAEKYFS